jgi:hypothetical protein
MTGEILPSVHHLRHADRGQLEQALIHAAPGRLPVPVAGPVDVDGH